MFVGLLALLEGNTSIRICPKSHKSNPRKIQLVELSKYEYVVMHPKIIHGGCGADYWNVRLHFYHGLPESAASQTDHTPFKTDNRDQSITVNKKILDNKKKNLYSQLAKAREIKHKNK